MTIIEDLEKASKEAAEAGVEMLRKSQMGFDFSGSAHDHHVAYTRTNASGAVSQIKQKGAAPARIPKRPAGYTTTWKGDAAKHTGKSEMIHGGLFHEIELLEGHMKGQKKWTQTGPAEAMPADTTAKPESKFKKENRYLKNGIFGGTGAAAIAAEKIAALKKPAPPR
jgi:hypothetical protein